MPRTARPLPPPEILHELLRYEPETGLLYWKPREGKKQWNTRFAGKQALSTTCKSGTYRRGYLLGKMTLAHRVVYSMVHNKQFDHEIDHINGDRLDNRPDNLRASSPAINARNNAIPSHNTSGVVGVAYRALCKKWRASITIENRQIHLGHFHTKEDAIAARKTAERANGFHENHGRSIQPAKQKPIKQEGFL